MEGYRNLLNAGYSDAEISIKYKDRKVIISLSFESYGLGTFYEFVDRSVAIQNPNKINEAINGLIEKFLRPIPTIPLPFV